MSSACSSMILTRRAESMVSSFVHRPPTLSFRCIGMRRSWLWLGVRDDGIRRAASRSMSGSSLQLLPEGAVALEEGGPVLCPEALGDLAQGEAVVTRSGEEREELAVG